MEKRSHATQKNDINDDAETDAKSWAFFFLSITRRLIKYNVKQKVNIVQFFTKVYLCILVAWTLNYWNNTNFNKNWDESNNKDEKKTINLWDNNNNNRSLSQVDVIRVTTYEPAHSKPWKRGYSQTTVSNVPRGAPLHNVPQKGTPNLPPPNGPPIRPPLQGLQKIQPPSIAPKGPSQQILSKTGSVVVSSRGPPPPHGPPVARHPQIPIRRIPQRGPPNGPLNMPPPRGPQNMAPPRGPQNMPLPRGPQNMAPPRGPQNRAPPRVPQNRAPPRGPQNAILPNRNKSHVLSKVRPPQVQSRKKLPSNSRTFSNNKKFLQESDANLKLTIVESTLQNNSDVVQESENKVEIKHPINVESDTDTEEKMDIVPHSIGYPIKVQNVEENNDTLGDIANTIMSNIHEIEMERNPALELIKENILDYIISANKGVIKNIDTIKENIISNLKGADGDWKPPIELIKETLLEKIGSLDPEEIGPKMEEIKDAVIEKITTNIACEVKPKLDNIKLTVLDKLDDINSAVVKPKINDLKDTINRKIINIENDVIPKIGNTIKDCVTDKIEDITSGIEKTSETIKDTIMSNVKTIYKNAPVPKNIKDMASRLVPDPNLSMEENMIDSVSKSTLGFGLIGNIKKRFKQIGNTSQAIACLAISVMTLIGGMGGFVAGNYPVAAGVMLIALLFSYYGSFKLLKAMFFPNFDMKKRNFFKRRKKKENKKITQNIAK
ncbi:Plasmodium exported protein, unknown function [Plasmodium gonderi]|uniref:Uncharacterized protein n=1 Tax=Plasmodium gonderi TaxID=77519 RepID=A0A1Y1JEK6_PLAGO|nr:Plasmodium exported protein, unknown function [Plasmodium gonderi]GAW79192.1 Plasmodium exported protein, unknown function [Plasmodium gonderi]